MNKELNAYQQVIWFWNGDKTVLGDLTNSQLRIIRDSIKSNDKREFFNSPRGLVLNAIKEIINYRHNNPQETIINVARERFSKRKSELANNIANSVMNLYIKPHLYNDKMVEKFV